MPLPDEYALANKVAHPLNVYLAERQVVPPLDDWLMLAFAPHRLSGSIDAMFDAQPDDVVDATAGEAERVVGE